jgi:hypothetical protein
MKMAGRIIFFFVASTLLCAAADAAFLDQSWEQPTEPPWANSICILSPIGQEFTPTVSSISSVELAISADFLNQRPGDISALTVRIRENTITGNILGQATVDAAADTAFMSTISGAVGWGWLQFDLGGSAPLTAGNVYVIEAWVPEMGALNWLWEGWVGDGSGLPGSAISAGEPSTGNAARGFRTYYVPEPATIFLLGLGGLFLRRRVSDR